MRDLRPHLQGIWPVLSRLAPAGGARVVQFMAARPGEGTSSLAASFGLMAAERSSRPAWLVDTDFAGNPLYNAFSKGRLGAAPGRPGRPLDASLGTGQIYAIDGAGDDPALRKLLTVHQIEQSRLFVTRFRNERLSPGQTPRHVTAPDWWAALRRISEWAVIDAPALALSPLGLQYARMADGVVLVVRAETTPASEVAALRAGLEAAGAVILGVVLNQPAGRRGP